MRYRPGILAFLFICNFLFLLANLKLISNILQTPKGTYFPLIHRNIADYYPYISAIREGRDGSVVLEALYTSENVQRKPVYLFYTLAGKIFSIVNLEPVWIYHFIRLLGYEIFFVVVYMLSLAVLGNIKAFWGGIIGILSTISPIMFFGKMFDGSNQLSWWYGMDSIGRLDLAAHHIWGITTMIGVILFWFRYIKRERLRMLYISLIFLILTIIIYPFPALALFFIPLISGVIYFFHKRGEKDKIDKRILVSSVMIFGVSFLVLLFMKKTTESSLPWSYPNIWEVAMWNSKSFVDRDILVGGGVLLLFVLPYIFYSFWRGNSFQNILLCIWIVLPYILLPFATYLGIGKIRLITFSNFIPMGIVAMLFIESLYKRIKTIRVKLIYLMSLIFYLLVSLPVSFYILSKNIGAPFGTYINITIPQSIMRSISFIKENVPKHSVILSTDYMGLLLPSFVSIRSFAAHPTLTIDYSNKVNQVAMFLEGKYGNNAEKFVKDNNIQYLYFGPLETNSIDNVLSYNLNLKKVYDQEGIVIYKVN